MSSNMKTLNHHNLLDLIDKKDYILPSFFLNIMKFKAVHHLSPEAYGTSATGKDKI